MSGARDGKLRICAGVLAALGFFFRNLFDLQMRTVLTTRMLPVIYGLGIGFAACFAVYLVVMAFAVSRYEGLFWLLLAGPLSFVVVVTALRVVLEFVLSVFRLAIQVEAVTAQTQQIAADLPRIQFWKGFLRNRDDAGRSGGS